jgi:IS5 family transposase
MALFPPGKGGGEDVAYGYKGKGILFHTLTDGNGMPLSCSTTPANGSEREQVMPLLDSIVVKSNRPGRPRKRVKVLAADKGYDSKDLRAALRKRGIRPQLPKRTWKTRKNRGRPIKISVPRFQQERCFAWFQRKYRRLVVRWERISACFNAFISLATIHLWISRILLLG